MASCENQRMSISVIIPTYNRAAFIAAAVQSALDQTRRPDEIIVVDDGSTDETERILSNFGPPVTVIRQPNCGRSAARNVGLRAATSDAVIFLDSDDLLMPQCIERCAKILQDQVEVGAVYTDAYFCDGDGNPIGIFSHELPGLRPSGIVLGELTRRNFLSISSMVRRSCIGDIAFDEGMEYAEDYDFWRQLAARCQFHYVDKPLTCYRLHEAMTSVTHLEEMLVAQAEVQRRIMDMPEFQNLTQREQARAFCIHGIKRAALGATGVARSFFRRSIRRSPTYTSPYALLLLSLFGTRALQFAILKRRQLAGNRLGTTTGPNALMHKQKPARRRMESDVPTGAIRNMGIKLSAGEAP